jgi:hypothetical protein
MPEQKPRRLSKQGTWRRHHPKGDLLARRVELYNWAYKLALEQISPDQKRARPDVSLRIHDSIRRQLKAGQTDPRAIAFEALKDALVPDTPS